MKFLPRIKMAKNKNNIDKNKLITFKYGFNETIFALIVCIVLFCGLLSVSVVFSLWGAIAILVLVAISLIVGLLVDGAIYPIYIDEKLVGFRGKRILWKDIKITMQRTAKHYDLIIGTSYFRGKEKIKQQKKILPCISVKNTKILKNILTHYKAKLLVVDRNGIEETPGLAGTDNKINAVIIEHNSAYNK